jgi:hypothetical protein
MQRATNLDAQNAFQMYVLIDGEAKCNLRNNRSFHSGQAPARSNNDADSIALHSVSHNFLDFFQLDSSCFQPVQFDSVISLDDLHQLTVSNFIYQLEAQGFMPKSGKELISKSKKFASRNCPVLHEICKRDRIAALDDFSPFRLVLHLFMHMKLW